MRLEIRKANIFHGTNIQSRPPDTRRSPLCPCFRRGWVSCHRGGLWFTPRRIMALIHPEQDFQLAKPPFASTAAITGISGGTPIWIETSDPL